VSDSNEIKSAIRTIVDGGTLTAGEASAAMDQIMTGAVTPAQIGAFVTALRIRGETVEEITGFAQAMRRHALHVDVEPGAGPVVGMRIPTALGGRGNGGARHRVGAGLAGRHSDVEAEVAPAGVACGAAAWALPLPLTGTVSRFSLILAALPRRSRR